VPLARIGRSVVSSEPPTNPPTLRERLNGYRGMPRRCCGYAKVAASKSSAVVTAAFGMKNELGRYSQPAAVSQVRQRTKRALNSGKKAVARCVEFWTPSKRSLKSGACAVMEAPCVSGRGSGFRCTHPIRMRATAWARTWDGRGGPPASHPGPAGSDECQGHRSTPADRPPAHQHRPRQHRTDRH